MLKCYKGTLLLAIHTAHKKRRITLGEKKHPAKLDYKDPWKKEERNSLLAATTTPQHQILVNGSHSGPIKFNKTDKNTLLQSTTFGGLLFLSKVTARAIFPFVKG